MSLNLPKLPKLWAPKKRKGRNSWRAERLRDCYDNVFSRQVGGLCDRVVKMRTDSLNGQTEDCFCVVRDDHSSKSKQEHIRHHRKHRPISADLVESFRPLVLYFATTEVTLLLLLLLPINTIIVGDIRYILLICRNGKSYRITHKHTAQGVLSSSLSMHWSSRPRETWNENTKEHKLHAKRTK